MGGELSWDRYIHTNIMVIIIINIILIGARQVVSETYRRAVPISIEGKRREGRTMGL